MKYSCGFPIAQENYLRQSKNYLYKKGEFKYKGCIVFLLFTRVACLWKNTKSIVITTEYQFILY